MEGRVQAKILIGMFTWTLATLSVVGVVLNIKKLRACFFIWIFTNAALMIYDFYIEEYAQSALFAVYFGTSIWGVVEWGRDGKKGMKEG